MKINSLEDLPGLKKGVKLAPYTTWKIGGPATFFWEPTIEFLEPAITYCKRNKIKVYYLGRGSNVLINDKGLDGLVICTKRVLQNIEFKDQVVEAESGVPMPKLSKMVARRGYGGYEFLIGIPGSVGAGVAINAGLTAKKRLEVKDYLLEADILDETGQFRTVSKDDLEMRYRGSAALDQRWYIIKARFRLDELSTPEEINSKTVEHLRDRKRKQPLSKATAGSTFKQPEGGKAAGWYIDHAGLKGLQVGDAKVSEKHANWIENTGNASSEDVKNLMEIIVSKVQKEFSVVLEHEVSFFN